MSRSGRRPRCRCSRDHRRCRACPAASSGWRMLPRRRTRPPGIPPPPSNIPGDRIAPTPPTGSCPRRNSDHSAVHPGRTVRRRPLRRSRTSRRCRRPRRTRRDPGRDCRCSGSSRLRRRSPARCKTARRRCRRCQQDRSNHPRPRCSGYTRSPGRGCRYRSKCRLRRTPLARCNRCRRRCRR